MKRESIKRFHERAGIVRSTLYRFYKEHNDLWKETKLINNRRMIPIHHHRYFDSALMFKEYKLLQEQRSRDKHRIACMKKMLKCLKDKGSMAYRLWDMDWTIIGTVSYKLDRSRNSCFNTMESYYKALVGRFGKRTDIRFFFTTETYEARDAYHNHFVVYLKDTTLWREVEKFTKDYFKYDRVECERYIAEQAWLFYMTKEGIEGTDWNIHYTDKTEFVANKETGLAA